MGRTVYLPTFGWFFHGFHVGKYTSPMEHMGNQVSRLLASKIARQKEREKVGRWGEQSLGDVKAACGGGS